MIVGWHDQNYLSDRIESKLSNKHVLNQSIIIAWWWNTLTIILLCYWTSDCNNIPKVSEFYCTKQGRFFAVTNEHTESTLNIIICNKNWALPYGHVIKHFTYNSMILDGYLGFADAPTQLWTQNETYFHAIRSLLPKGCTVRVRRIILVFIIRRIRTMVTSLTFWQRISQINLQHS